MKKLRNLIIVAVLTLMMVMNTGCGSSFDASGYVDSFMKMLTQGDVADYVKMTGATEEEALEEYQAMADSMKEMIGDAGAGEETQEKLTNAYLELLKKSKYTVGEAEKQDDGSYMVRVDIEPITGIYEGLMDELTEELTAAVTSGEVDTDGVYDWMFDKMADKMTERMENISYGEVQSVDVHIVKDDKVYKIEDEEAIGEKIGTLLIDQSAMQ